MIAHLRRRHRVMVTTLFALVIVAYVLGLMARRFAPRIAHPPGAESHAGHEEVVR